MNKTTRLKKPQIPELETLYTFDELGGRPKYGGVEMTSETDIPSFQEIMDETHSAVVAEATARDDADEALEAEIQELAGQTSEALENEAETRAAADTALREAVNSEASTRGAADNVLQNQIDAIVASSDVKDIVGTKAELDAYDKSTLGDNDIIKVLQDESQSNATTYYRYAEATDSFTLIGAEGPYYTKGQADALLNNKADKATTYTKTEVDATVSGLEADIATKQDQLTAGENITIDNNVISAEASVKKLTSEDFNYPVNNPDKFAWYLLDTGFYSIPAGTTLRTGGSGGDVSGPLDFLVIGGAQSSTSTTKNIKVMYPLAYDSTTFGAGFIYEASAINYTAGTARVQSYRLYQLENNLSTVSSGWRALDAYQGKVLKDMIGNLSNLTTADKTNLVAAINELVAAAPADFTGTDGTTAGTHGLVPAPATTDAGKFLKADGTWDDAGSPINVVQTTGTSTADVMSQNATTSMVFADPATKNTVRIGRNATVQGAGTGVVIGAGPNGASIGGNGSTAIGTACAASGAWSLALGNSATASGTGTVALSGTASAMGSVALGVGAETSTQGVASLGIDNANVFNNVKGYNNTKYRLLTGLYDPQADHDAATKGYVDTAIAAAGGAEEISAADWSNLWQ